MYNGILSLSIIAMYLYTQGKLEKTQLHNACIQRHTIQLQEAGTGVAPIQRHRKRDRETERDSVGGRDLPALYSLSMGSC